MGAKVLLFLLIGSSTLAAAEDVQGHPVSKVMTLLKDMIVQLEKEGKEDAEIFENIGCWCETNEKEKTKSIKEAEQRISSLTSAIEEYTGESARLNTEVANLNKEITKNQQALDTATALRTKQLAEFNDEEKDMLQSITSLKNAVISLSKHNAAMLQGRNPFMSKSTVMLQVPDSESISVIVGLHQTLREQSEKIKQVITPEQLSTLESFVQNPDRYSGESFVQKPRSELAQQMMKIKEKAPQSGEIFGILSAMKESFETNLANTQKEEADNVKSYEDLKAAKESQISTEMNQESTKSTQLASSDEKLAQSKEDLEDTQETLAADTEFLADVRDKCTNSDQEYEERTKTRQLEIEAVTKALSFLTSDEAHELMTRTFSAALVQRRVAAVVSSRSSTRRMVSQLLQKVADKARDPRLSAIALKVRLDAFQKVKDTMTKMIDTLLKEKDDEIKHKDVCIENFNKNDRASEVATQNRDDLQAQIDDYTATIDDLNKSIETLNAEIAEMRKQLKYAGEDRELANKDFQITVADQRATQKLLTAALNVLKGFYEKSALLQQPAGFKKYQKNKNAGGVMGMIQSIIDDAKAMEADAIRAEEDSQEDYEAFVKETNEGLEERGKNLINKQSVRGKTEKAKVEAEVERDEEIAELQLLASELHDIHIDCDFLMKNWDIRVTARDEEIEALKQGIAMFSGASFSSLAQHYQGPF